jgi:hypothetical protein
MKQFFLLTLIFVACFSLAQEQNVNKDPFRQLHQELPTPNVYRTASGAPGHMYWQQRADYSIDVEIDDEQQKLMGEETITYFNQSPDDLRYLWLQLDQNVRAKDSDSYKIQTSSMRDRLSFDRLDRFDNTFDGGFKIQSVKDAQNTYLSYSINKTMMRVDLPSTLKPGETFTFKIKWWYNINNHRVDGGRSGFEHFAEDGNNVYVIAQWFPRMCVYNEVYGWQNKQFLGRGEFALTFGNYDVRITVPEDHLVAASGELQNPRSVLSREHFARFEKAKNEFEQPVIISSGGEADARMQNRASRKKTWHFVAENVRDFAFASSRRFIWDAMGVKMSDGRTVVAQSMYIKEGRCVWEKYSTKAVAHTIKWYSHFTFDYPYPVAWSIDGNMGMEYPMIAFNYGRCAEDGTYTERTKYGHIGVVIHEVGHNWFPMIVNSDERQWTWMDEGLNSFVQYLTEQQWERNYPSRSGPAPNIVSYMASSKDRLTPIMTNSESIYQFGNNAYGKPATALNILRETVMGRELFDYSFKEFANRWKFKHPAPADFFRTMEDASGVDLDWFWRGWFYTTDHCDMAISEVNHYRIDPKNPDVVKLQQRQQREQERKYISELRYAEQEQPTYDEVDTTLLDFYSRYDPLDVDAIDQIDYERFVSTLSEEELAQLNSTDNFYEITIEKIGGLVMPVILQFQYADGTVEYERLPAEIWKLKPDNMLTKVFRKEKEVTRIVLDPFLETADINTDDNFFPPKPVEPSRFEVYKSRQFQSGENPMQRANRAKKVIKP